MSENTRRKTKASKDNLLAIPPKAGRAIIEAGAILACPLLGTERFVKFCTDRGLKFSRERLVRLERLGLFAPVYRVRSPKRDAPPFYIPIRKGNNWFTKRWAWDTTAVPQRHPVPAHTDRSQEAYYSIFQVDYLDLVLAEMEMGIHLDAYLDRSDEPSVNWQSAGERWIDLAGQNAEGLRNHMFRRAVALLCQHISNRYYPQTQGDKRVIRVGGSSFFDHWTSVPAFDWDWAEEARGWDPRATERLYALTPRKLRHAYETFAGAQSHCDPLERWYQLMQFVALRERERLKGSALLAETLRSGAYMLRLLYKDLYGEELPHPNEVARTVIAHTPELEVRRDARRYLEFVANRYGINPQPKLALIVEGPTEESAITKIFEEYYGAHPGVHSIEIIVLGGVGTATGSKKRDRFRAILRLIDYLHHHQTFAFLILDNENYASNLKQEARKAKSVHSDRRYVTRPEYIRIWKDSFEFDNFSCTEIASALNEVARGHATFTVREVMSVKHHTNPGAELEKLYHRKTVYDLPKIKLNEILVRYMLSPRTRRKVESRPIIGTLDRVAALAGRNPFPVTQELWERNQASKFLGKKHQPKRRRKEAKKSSAMRPSG